MYIELLQEVFQWRKSNGLLVQPPCSEDQIQKLYRRARAELGSDLPDAYGRFLRLTNGLSSNGLVVYASNTIAMAGHADRLIEGLVEANLAWRGDEAHRGFVFFAEGEISRYAFNQNESKYQVLDLQTDTPIQDVRHFDELLLVALRSHRPNL